MSQDKFLCNVCRVTVAVKRRGVVRIVSPAVAEAVELNRVLVRCKCGGEKLIWKLFLGRTLVK